MSLDDFNRLAGEDQLRALLEICSSPAWARQVVASAPFADDRALLDLADQVLVQLPDIDLDSALAGHPRIGDRTESPSSAQEQAGVADADSAVLTELAEKNAAYEYRFGYVYLVCASGRSALELLAVLVERLGNDAATERHVMRSELAKINQIRIRRLLCEA